MATEERRESERLLREQLTIAEDALRDMASPGFGLVQADDGCTSFDTTTYGRVAEGALQRMREAEERARA